MLLQRKDICNQERGK